MKRNTLFSALALLMIISATVLLSQKNRDKEEATKSDLTNAGPFATTVIAAHTTWSGVVHIPDEVHITEDGSVSLLPGTIICLYDGVQMLIDGGFSANFGISEEHASIRPLTTYNGPDCFSISTSASVDFHSIDLIDLHNDGDNDRDATTGIIHIVNNDNVSFENCRFINCSGDLGGVIYCDNSDISITNCEFKSNKASSGGAIFLVDSNPTLIGNLFWNNSADNGSAIYAEDSNPVIVNNTFRHDLHEVGQCMMYLMNSTPDIYNTIFYNEGDSQSDCSIYLGGTSQPDLWNCVVYNGKASFGGEPFTGTYRNVIESDPQFVDNYQTGYVIENRSPCVNAGLHPVPNITLPLKDIAQKTRINGSMVDIGAYESQQSKGEIHVTNNIARNTCWRSDVVYIDADVSVLDNVTLTVRSDVKIVLADSCNFEIIGSMHIYGSENEPVSICCPDNSRAGATLTITDYYRSSHYVRGKNHRHRHEKSATRFSYCHVNSIDGSQNGEGVKVVVVSLEDVLFEHCIFGGSGTENNGGCLEIKNSSPVIRDCEFSSGNAVSGGAIYANHSDFMLLASVLHDNHATNGGAIYLDEYGSPFIANCTIVDNSADHGGALYCYEGTASPIVVNSILYSNTASEGPQGYFYNSVGAGLGPDDDPTGFFFCNIQGGRDSLYVHYSKTSKQRAKYAGGYSSNIDCEPSFVANSFELQNTSLCINKGTVDGWSILSSILINDGLVGYPPTDNLYDIGAKEVTHQSSIAIGGVIGEDCLLFADTIFVSNDATITQGITVIVDTLVSCIQFNENVSVHIQGNLQIAGTENNPILVCAADGATEWQGMHVDSTGSLMFEYVKVTDASGVTGGAISTSEGCVVTVSNCEFSDNHANSGGGLYVNGGEIRIDNTLFSKNVAHDGGAIYHVDSDTLDIARCVFSENVAETGNGGAIFSSGSVRLIFNLFHHNSAVKGGAIYQEDGDIICLSATIMRNQASLAGGGIALNSNAQALRLALLNSNYILITPQKQRILRFAI